MYGPYTPFGLWSLLPTVGRLRFVDLNGLSQPWSALKISALPCLFQGVSDLEGSVSPGLGVEVVVEVDVAGDTDDATQVEDDVDPMQHC